MMESDCMMTIGWFQVVKIDGTYTLLGPIQQRLWDFHKSALQNLIEDTQFVKKNDFTCNILL